MIEPTASEQNPPAPHYTESFIDASDLTGHTEWGYQCFTCRLEAVGYEDLDSAEAAADQHVDMANDSTVWPF
jgi:hypothetical protein